MNTGYESLHRSTATAAATRSSEPVISDPQRSVPRRENEWWHFLMIRAILGCILTRPPLAPKQMMSRDILWRRFAVKRMAPNECAWASLCSEELSKNTYPPCLYHTQSVIILCVNKNLKKEEVSSTTDTPSPITKHLNRTCGTPTPQGPPEAPCTTHLARPLDSPLQHASKAHPGPTPSPPKVKKNHRGLDQRAEEGLEPPDS